MCNNACRKILQKYSELQIKTSLEPLTVKEIQDVLDDIYVRYPQVQLYLKSKQMNGIADLVRSAKGDAEKESVELNIEEFKKALSLVDSQVKFLPATAQVVIFFFRVNRFYSFQVANLI